MLFKAPPVLMCKKNIALGGVFNNKYITRQTSLCVYKILPARPILVAI